MRSPSSALLIDFTSRTDRTLRLAIKTHSQTCCQAKRFFFTGFLESPSWRVLDCVTHRTENSLVYLYSISFMAGTQLVVYALRLPRNSVIQLRASTTGIPFIIDSCHVRARVNQSAKIHVLGQPSLGCRAHVPV